MWRDTATVAAVWASLAATVAADAVNHPSAFYSQLRPCPAECVGTPANWTVYSSLERLALCKEPMLVDFAIYNPLNNPQTTARLRACTAGNANDTRNGILDSEQSVSARSDLSAAFNSSSCGLASESKVSLDLLVSDESGPAAGEDLQAAVEQLQKYLADETHCGTKFLVGYSQKAVVAVYSGAAINNPQTIPSALKQLTGQLAGGNAPKTVTMQLCGDDRNADHTLGVAVDTSGDLSVVQSAVMAWSNGTCVSSTQTTKQLQDVSIYETALVTANGTASANGTLSVRHPRSLQARSDCTTVTVVSGDSCGSLASKCGISATDFTKYNTASNLCSSLTVGQRVCCSAGTLPDITPKPNADGSCATYTVASDDYCALIAASNGLTVQQISDFNDKTTWGWNGCSNLFAGINICLSKGTPPLPAPVANALCGPTVPGTTAPDNGTALADLNPCPLNSCCDVWGQCGTTPAYCTIDLGPTGNPGTAPTGVNGCVSNCGTDIKNNDDPPATYKQVGYYESWNWDRPCLNYRAIDIAGTAYTHVHWAFATVNSDFSVNVNDTYHQMADFMSLSANKVLSFGGWGYSTDPATYDILRTAMDPANVNTFADNVIKYISDNGFDGVDFDWEYPGAPDIPGIPPGLETDAPNYLNFLRTMRKKIPLDKSLSIAAPASYWYLKAFPIADMSKLVDYVVYMTYDLHGQWDYSNQWSQDGCVSGNCLRSHVNLTETMYALAMVTKAGAQANKITVGVSSYGRAFGLNDRAACEKDLSSAGCTFTGPESGATPGVCTETAGYISNAEINEMLDTNKSDTLYVFDHASDSDNVFYGNNWVSYMTETTKSTRTQYYRDLNFGGTIDWAVDLAAYTDDDGLPDGDDDDDDDDDTDPLPDCTATFKNMDELDAAVDSIPDHCMTIYSLATLNNVLTEVMSNYTDLMNEGYDKKFQVYAKAVASSSTKEVNDFVQNNGNKYFTCIVGEATVCCDQCKIEDNRASSCDYCFKDGPCTHSCNLLGCDNKRDLNMFGQGSGSLAIRGDGGPPTIEPIVKMTNQSEPCPPDFSKRGQGPDNPYEQSVWWTLVNDTGFYADLLESTGVPKDKTKLKNVDRGNACAPSASSDDDCWGYGMDFNIPASNGYEASDVANPKDIVQKAQDKAGNIGTQISDIIDRIELEGYWGDEADLIDSFALPVLMLASATEQMATIEEIADEITEEQKKAFIMAFLSAIFFMVPVIGEVVGAVAELADIATILALVGAAGNIALDAYTIATDPKNAPLAIFDLVLEPLAFLDVDKIAQAASIRRTMKAEDVAKLGAASEKRLNTIEKLKGTCISDIPVDA